MNLFEVFSPFLFFVCAGLYLFGVASLAVWIYNNVMDKDFCYLIKKFDVKGKLEDFLCVVEGCFWICFWLLYIFVIFWLPTLVGVNYFSSSGPSHPIPGRFLD
jgi:hypothetical protein